MGLFTSTQAAASAVDVNHLRDQPYQTSNMPRVLRGAAYVGSAATGDAAVAIKIGQVEVARLFNSRAGAVMPNRDDLMPLNVYIPPGAQLSAPIVDAGLTNQTVLLLHIDDLPIRRG